MIIQVTQEDIDNGRRSSSSHCPVALAFARALGIDNRQVVVGPSYMYSNLLDANKKYNTPSIACGFIIFYDSGQKVHPFEFELGEPCE